MSTTTATAELLELVTWSDTSPVAFLALAGTGAFGRSDVPLVQLFTPEEQRARTSQAYVRSAVGDRLRHIHHEVREDAVASVLVIEQGDAATGIRTRTSVTRPHSSAALRVQTSVHNDADEPIVLTAVSSLTLGFGLSEDDLANFTVGYARSEWLAEDRWTSQPLREVLPKLSLPLHGQDGRGHFGVTSHGSWSTGEYLPAGYLASAGGTTAVWQIESSAAWHWDLSQTAAGGVLTLLGPTELEHGFAVQLNPGQEFTTVPAAIALGDGFDAAVAELTRYRRWLRSSNTADDSLPVVYNDFMNTLMGEPSTAALLPLIDAAATAGAEVFCIDAGWFADPTIGDWWATVGDWEVFEDRFAGGFRPILDRIHGHGMRSGIWLEPEVIGVDIPIAQQLPEAAFFHRWGRRVQEHRRYHLDFRHPAARAHLDATVDRLVSHGITYFKLDYNINPGAGTDDGGISAAAGLLGHARAFAEWVSDVRRRHPQISVENCSSGAMRADYGMLAVTQLQSTSDQQDFLLYPPIAASAPVTILPEQAGNWAYPSAAMTAEEVAFTLITGLSGRLYLSGFLHELSAPNKQLVAEAVRLAKQWTGHLSEALPVWPLGLPTWSDDIVCLGLDTGETQRVFVWNRSKAAQTLTIPSLSGPLMQVFPPGAEASTSHSIKLPKGPSARVYEVCRTE